MDDRARRAAIVPPRGFKRFERALGGGARARHHAVEHRGGAGAATYSIPISLPPGSGGMAPELALTYSSQGGNGPFGPGWQLSGLSAITRCPATLANDGFIDGVDLDDNDRLCLDGQRLVAIAGAYGAAGTAYCAPTPELFSIHLATGDPENPFDTMTAAYAKFGRINGAVQNAVLIQDVNGDGLDDILSEGIDPATGNEDDNFKGYALYLNTGLYQKDPAQLGPPWPVLPDQIVFSTWPLDSGVRTHGKVAYKNKWGDFNGDGAADLMIYDVPTQGQYNIAYGRPQATGITRITNGLGAQIEVVYKPLTDASVYTKATGASYPIREVQAAIPVVAEFAQSNGLGGFKRTRFVYAGLRSDAKRGSLGFASITSTDLETGLSTTTTYRQVFPLTGAVSSVQVKTGSGKLVATTNNTHVAGQLGSGAATRHVPLLTRIDARSYEPAAAGIVPVTSTRTDHTYDSWGNVTKSTVSTYAGNVGNGTPHQVVTINTYAATDVANWTLARLTRAVVDKTLPDGTATRRVSAFEYDGKGLLRAEIIEPDDASLRLRTEYVRDLFGNLTQTTIGAGAPEARSSALGYDAKGRYPESATNPLGQVARTTYDARWGQPTRVEGVNHSAATPMATTATYDAFGRAASTTDVLGKTAEVVREWCTETLCPAARYGPRASYRVEARAADGGKSAVVYDALERAIGTETLMFDGRWSRQVTTHDPTGRVAETTAPCFDGETPHVTAYAHDELGRPIAESSDAHQGDTSGSRRIALEYGPLWVRQTDPRGKVRVTDQNAIGQVVRVRDPDGRASTFDYDPEGNLIRSTDALGNVATLEYDVRGLKVRSVDPDMGAWTYTYTRFGELATQTDAKGQVVDNTYDRLGRLVRRVDAQGTDAERTTTWTWDTLWKGALSALSSTDGYAEALTYTAKGQLATRTQKIAGVDYTYAYAYDAWGRVQTLTYPSQFRVSQTFTPYGHLQSVVDASTGAALVTIQSGDARGNTTGQVYGNGVRTLRTFDAAQGFVRGITATAPDATVLHQMAFDWDLPATWPSAGTCGAIWRKPSPTTTSTGCTARNSPSTAKSPRPTVSPTMRSATCSARPGSAPTATAPAAPGRTRSPASLAPVPPPSPTTPTAT